MRISLNYNGNLMFEELMIKQNMSILDTLKEMDKRRKKLLIVSDDLNRYVGLVSIGDIQRAIINNINLDTGVKKIIKSDPLVSFTDEGDDLIKQRMRDIRAEFMPVLDRQTFLLERVLFWTDLFEDAKKNHVLRNIPVVIMAGGKGTRLKPISNIIPKPLLPIGERTMIEEIIQRFRNDGVNKFYVSVNYKKEMIQYYLDSLDDYKDLEYVVENRPLGTAGSLSLLKGKIDGTFFVSNCDILVDQSYDEVYEYHKNNKNELTLVAALKHLAVPYGVLDSEDKGLLTKIKEKPELTFKINTGVYLIEPHLLAEIPDDTFFHITDLIDQIQNRNGRVGVFPISEKSWVDVGEWPGYIKTVRELSPEKNFIGL